MFEHYFLAQRVLWLVGKIPNIFSNQKAQKHHCFHIGIMSVLSVSVKNQVLTNRLVLLSCRDDKYWGHYYVRIIMIIRKTNVKIPKKNDFKRESGWLCFLWSPGSAKKMRQLKTCRWMVEGTVEKTDFPGVCKIWVCRWVKG